MHFVVSPCELDVLRQFSEQRLTIYINSPSQLAFFTPTMRLVLVSVLFALLVIVDATRPRVWRQDRFGK